MTDKHVAPRPEEGWVCSNPDNPIPRIDFAEWMKTSKPVEYENVLPEPFQYWLCTPHEQKSDWKVYYDLILRQQGMYDRITQLYNAFIDAGVKIPDWPEGVPHEQD